MELKALPRAVGMATSFGLSSAVPESTVNRLGQTLRRWTGEFCADVSRALMIHGRRIASQSLPLNKPAEENDELIEEKRAPAQMTWKCT
jgi:hypothetical protein